MPTNRKYRTRKMKQTTISPALRFYFETGSYDGPFPEEDLCDVFLFACRKADLKVTWDAVKDEIMTDWIRKHPETRPFAWWCFDSPEPRRTAESQAAYLARHGLLTAAEKRHIERHPELLEPEPIV